MPTSKACISDFNMLEAIVKTAKETHRKKLEAANSKMVITTTASLGGGLRIEMRDKRAARWIFRVATSTAEEFYNKQAFLPISFPEPDDEEDGPETPEHEPEPSEFAKIFFRAVEIAPPPVNMAANMVMNGLLFRQRRLIYHKQKEKEYRKNIGPALYVRALIRDENGTGWGHLLEWTDRDGKLCQHALQSALLCKTGNPWFSALLDHGYITDVENNSVSHLSEF